MRLSLLLEALSSDAILQSHLLDEEQNIHQICGLSAASAAFSEDVIYISTTSFFRGMHCSFAPSIFVLIQDEDILGMQDLPQNYIIYHNEYTVGGVFTLLLSRFALTDRVTDAELTISRALFDCSSIKDILDVASSLLGNPILLQDFTTRLLAYSSIEEMEIDDEILNSVFNVGYVTTDLFQKYDYVNVLETIKNTPQTFLLESPKKRDRMICRLFVNRRYFGWFLTVAYHQSFREGDREIMNFLCGALQLFLEKENILPNLTRSENLLQELLHKEAYSDASFKERAEGFSWQLHDHYYLMIVSAGADELVPRTIMAYKNHLSLIYPEAVIFEEDSRLVLFFDVKDLTPVIKTLRPFLQKYHLKASHSSQFSKTTEFSKLYQQALSVLFLGNRLHPEEVLYDNREYSIYCAIEELNRTGGIRYYCMPELIQVYQYDRLYGTSFAASKRLVLELASVTLAAKKLELHRNTMEYRMKKFNEISGIETYTASLIERLMFSYKILDLFPHLIE